MPLFLRLWPLLALLLLPACSSVPTSTYAPKLGQMGKDVMWLPTRDELVTQMLTMAQVSPQDEVVDLGAGDGKIAIAAARQFGARVVSNTFGMGDCEPDQVIQVGSNTGYFWKVPAQVAGQWSVHGLDRRGPVRLALTQRHQRVGGTLATAAAQGHLPQPLLGTRIDGADLHFSFVKEDGQLQAVQVRVQGDTMAGQWVAPYGMLEGQPEVVKVSAQRLQGH